MKKRKITILIILLIFSSSFLIGQEKEKIIAIDYKIGPKDLIEISVFGLEEMKSIVRRVSEDGKITLPLIGEIEVEGLNTTQLEKKLAELLEAKWLQNPQLSVFIREFQSRRVSVLGAVTTPGPCDLLGRLTLLQVISLVGGLTPDAGNEIIVIRETEAGESQSIKILIDDLMVKGDPRYNIPIEPGDIINIPADKIVYIYVLGQVKSPSALPVKRSYIPTLLQAIAQAGGFTERAQKTTILVKRIENGVEKQIKVNVRDIIRGKKKDFQLLENDTVFVPETIF